MNAAEWQARRFYRDARHAWLGGVCAGLADYFGFNRCVVRVLTVLMFLMAAPMTILAYIACVLLVPSNRSRPEPVPKDPEFRRAVRANPSGTLSDVKRRFQRLDQRLARLERYVTSSRFDLDQEFNKL